MVIATIVICTHEREDFLYPLLLSLGKQTSVNPDFAVLVVNNSQQPLSDRIKKTLIDHHQVTIVSESQPGLSYARNTGIKHANSSWIIFLDDDVQLPDDFLTKALTVIESDQFDCFGGMYYPWYIEEKPKWLPASFGQKVPLRTTTGPITPGIEGYLSGGIFAVKKAVIEKVGGFRTDLGMGTYIGYGEEDELQIRTYQAGYRIGFVPDWWMKHAVLPHKCSVIWQLRSVYAKARDAQFLKGSTAAAATIFKLSGSIMAAFFKRFPLAVWKLLTARDYYWQNAVLDILTPVIAYAGRNQGIKLFLRKTRSSCTAD